MATATVEYSVDTVVLRMSPKEAQHLLDYLNFYRGNLPLGPIGQELQRVLSDEV